MIATTDLLATVADLVGARHPDIVRELETSLQKVREAGRTRQSDQASGVR